MASNKDRANLINRTLRPYNHLPPMNMLVQSVIKYDKINATVESLWPSRNIEVKLPETYTTKSFFCSLASVIASLTEPLNARDERVCTICTICTRSKHRENMT